MKCPKCGKEFEPHHVRQKYCSRDCRVRAAGYRYYHKNVEACLARVKKWRDENREKLAFIQKKYRWRKAGETL